MGGGVIAAATAGVALAGAPAAIAAGALGYSAIGSAVGGGMDMAGTYAQTGTIRPMQSAFATLTGGIAGPIGAGSGFITSVILGGAINAINTEFNNSYYGESNSLPYAFGVGSLTAAGGSGVGVITTKGLQQIVKPYVYPTLNPAVPAILQPRVPNPTPGFAGAVTGGVTAGTSSFVPSKEPQK
ncbi:hypothetical protein ACFSHT_02495 [Paraburkholderia silviterrae]|uniref:Uncharacterized protein n=1 Tax=Paraburkholderia silviterrae TaxID=2528715 RepID=A0A4R5MH67_9BURK|nr:hypothetical protein [Paraburkholderia silviterrae]TDG26457.1 hypothetical protein EYW47_03690 [Paraburkholderia silviterrae]